jgi:hypothetical protein
MLQFKVLLLRSPIAHGEHFLFRTILTSPYVLTPLPDVLKVQHYIARSREEWWVA